MPSSLPDHESLVSDYFTKWRKALWKLLLKLAPLPFPKQPPKVRGFSPPPSVCGLLYGFSSDGNHTSCSAVPSVFNNSDCTVGIGRSSRAESNLQVVSQVYTLIPVTSECFRTLSVYAPITDLTSSSVILEEKFCRDSCDKRINLTWKFLLQP